MCENNRIMDFNGREFLYTGEMKNNMANGYGKGIYTGFYESNSGYCFSALYKNNTYIGEWVNNTASGYGKFCGVDPERYNYEGNWLNGRHHGFGAFTFGDTKYIGFWVHSLRHGHGLLKDVNGTYEGQFQADKKEGMGIMVIDGKEYRVEFKNNKLHNGFCKSKKYTGWIKNGKRDGFGVYKYDDRRAIYKGFHKNNKFHGQGTLTSRVSCEEGVWNNGILMDGITTFKRSYTINGKVMFKGYDLNEKRKGLEKKKLTIVLDKILLENKLSMGTREDITQILNGIGY